MMSFVEEGIASCRISSTSDVGKCPDCLECQTQGIEGRLGARKGTISRNKPRRACELPIVVDLTNDEAKVTWEESETSFKAADDIQEPCAMIADSSSRLHRDNNGNNSLATALRDRGSCVIPVQPNRCLPIHPAPPVPTRAAPIPKSRKDRSPVLKLVKASTLNVVDVEPIKSTTLDVNGDLEEKKTILDRDSCSFKVADSVKRKLGDERCKERGKDGTKDSKKRRKSSEVNSDEFCKSCTNNFDKEGGKTFKGTTTEVCNGKKCGTSIVGSTTESHFGKEKVVPPLRLKKIIQEGKNATRGNAEVPSSRDKEPNYRIVTGATPRPDSATTPTTCEYWTRENFDKDRNFDVASASSTTHDVVVRRSSAKSDDYKLKYRRNRLRQKLKELQSKALNLAQEIADGSNCVDSSPQRNTRLRQMMNCYEKQIENVSKLLNKLYNGNPVTKDAVDIEVNKTDYRLDGEFVRHFSPISSPEPPKLSPRSPVNYPNKSPDSVRNSPPVLPKVCLNVSSNLDILISQDTETVQLPAESTWVTCEDNNAGISSMTDNFFEEMTNQDWEANNNESQQRLKTPQVLSSTSIDPCSSENVDNIENEEFFLNKMKEAVDKDSINAMQEKKEAVKELAKTIEVVTSNLPIIEETNAIKKQEVTETDNSLRISPMKGPIISSVTSGSEIPSNVRCNDVNMSTLPITTTQIPATTEMRNILQLQTNYYDSTILNKNVLSVNKAESSKKSQKVSSNSTQSRKMNYSIATTLNPAERPFANQHYPAQNSNERRIMTEQFPTLGNWVAKMSKKQVSKQKSKLQTAANSITISTEESIRTSEFDTHKVSATNSSVGNRGNVLNIAPQWNTEKWHRQQHHQQRQQQQLFQHVAATAAPQSLPSASALNSGICGPLSGSQFYPSNYSIDPYSGATFGYHSALCPVYSTYPYSRLHPGAPLTSYHIPMQNPLNPPLRPLPHVDKHLSSLQDPSRNFTSDILKYPATLPTTGFQPPNDFGFDRLRGTSTSHNSEANCLSPLLLASSSLPSGTQQTLPRTSLSGYPPNNNQYGRNRMIPDVVAAAAAAAVVAAASIGRQRASLPPYTKPSAATVDSVMEVDPARLSSNTSNTRTREHLLSNQGQSVDVGTKEPQWNGAGYHSLPNLLLDGLPFVRTEHEFPQASTLSSNVQDTESATSLPQMSKEDSRSVERECETPHLGKVNRSPDTLINLKCSNCGVAGSMFKCLGCEVAFYCNERCQARHWSVHVEKCPKKMPKLKKVT